MTTLRVPADRLRAGGEVLLAAAGTDPDVARAVARRVVESDLLGHRTHGVWFMRRYLERIIDGTMRATKEERARPSDGPCLFIEGNRTPGAWVMDVAIEHCTTVAARLGVAAAAVQNSGHIGCLSTYLLDITRRGLIGIVCASNPGVASVAPLGGIDPVITTNPMAFGAPSRGEPLLIDQCTSLISNVEVTMHQDAGTPLEGEWLVGMDGGLTDDPHAAGASILPLGGDRFGYKGFGFGLMVETLALVLTGYGRSGGHDIGGQGVFVLCVDPARFAGADAFLDEQEHLHESCRTSRPRPGTPGPRLPGARALALWREQEELGVEIDRAVYDEWSEWGRRLGVDPWS